jgi:hypothetical protein
MTFPIGHVNVKLSPSHQVPSFTDKSAGQIDSKATGTVSTPQGFITKS